MRKNKHFFGTVSLTALLFAVFAAGGIAQDRDRAGIANPETDTPVILTTTPSDGEEDVDLDSVFEITFSSEMDETTLNDNTVKLRATSDNMHQTHDEMMPNNQMRETSAINHTEQSWNENDTEQSWNDTEDAVKGTVSYSNRVVTFTPEEDLKEGTHYTLTVTNGVRSSENVAIENDQEWCFTTKEKSDSDYSDRQSDTQSDRYTSGDNRLENNERSDNRDSRSTMDRSDNRDSRSTMDRSDNRDRLTMDRSDNGDRSTYSDSSNRPEFVDLGKAGQFVILSKTSINNKSESTISGHTGEGSEENGDTEEGFEETGINQERDDSDSAWQRTSAQDGVWHSNQSDTASPDVSEAIEDMMSAFCGISMQNGNDVTSHNNERFNSDELTAGIHEWNNSLNLESDITLSGSEDDVWLFKIGDNLTVDENVKFTLNSGAQAENIFWFVKGDVTIGENAEFEGIILSMNEIALEKGAKLNGRMFSRSSITLDDNTINEPETMTGRTLPTNRTSSTNR